MSGGEIDRDTLEWEIIARVSYSTPYPISTLLDSYISETSYSTRWKTILDIYFYVKYLSGESLTNNGGELDHMKWVNVRYTYLELRLGNFYENGERYLPHFCLRGSMR